MALNELFRSLTEIEAALEPEAGALDDEEGVLELLELLELQAAISSAALTPAPGLPREIFSTSWPMVTSSCREA
jgi:hypothetical protein